MHDPDQLPNGRSIYDVSKSELFWRNFLAGFARGLGGFIFTVLIFFIITALTAQFLMPIVNPIFDSMTSTSEMFESLNSFPGNNNQQVR